MKYPLNGSGTPSTPMSGDHLGALPSGGSMYAIIVVMRPMKLSSQSIRLVGPSSL